MNLPKNLQIAAGLLSGLILCTVLVPVALLVALFSKEDHNAPPWV